LQHQTVSNESYHSKIFQDFDFRLGEKSDKSPVHYSGPHASMAIF